MTHAPVPGVTGRAVASRAAHLPPAGYEAKQLDGSLQGYVVAADRAVKQINTLSERIDGVLDALQASDLGASALEQAERGTMLAERMAKVCLALVRATDDLTRLRSFLAGGPDSRPDLTVRGELDLRAIVLAAVRDLGWKVVEAA